MDGALADESALLLPPPRTAGAEDEGAEDAGAFAIAVPGGGATRRTWPTSIALGTVRLFQRTMFCVDVRFSRATFDTVSPRSTR